MSAAATPSRDRIDELLADRTTCGLSDSGEFELRSLVDGDVEIAGFETELAAAALALAFLPAAGTADVMPWGVREKIESAARVRGVPGGVRPALAGPVEVAARSDGVVAKLNWWAWMAAAASLTLAAIGWWPRLAGGGGRVTPEEIAREPGAVTTTWASWAPKAPDEDPLAKPIDWSAKVTGRVIWSSDRQTGCMVFTGMKPNDPTQEQYQLWIIDAKQKHPIDGGVFDITQDGEAVVPITPKIRVDQPVAFAVTIEKPGGVVVSEQHERVVVAALQMSK